MATFTYPGVYIEELPSGTQTITGVATSIAAFIGWSNQGPVNEAVMVESWTEYQTIFGGLIPGVYLGYAVYQFFLNGGSQAYIIRLVDTLSGTPAQTASGTFGTLQLYANNPGAWGNNVCVSITNVNVAGGVTTFNLQVAMLNPSGMPTMVESYTNLSTSPTSPQYALTVINNDSNYLSFTSQFGTPPSSLSGAPTGPTATVWIVAGAVSTTTPFQPGETVTQPATGTTATLLGTVNGSYLVLSTSPSGGTPNSSSAWTGNTSTANFAPTTAPVSTTALPLCLAASPALGADGATLTPNDPTNFEKQLTNTSGVPGSGTGYQLLSSVPIFDLLCVPGENSAAVVGNMQQFCAQYRAFLIVDSAYAAVVGTGSTGLSNTGPADGNNNVLTGSQYASNSAFYFPWVSAPDPQVGNRPTLFPPCGFVAGIYASTDASVGVWKAPAGINIGLTGALGLQYVLTDMQNGLLNPLAVNCLRQFPIYGEVVWGARTMAGADAVGSQWKYIPIRRLALFLESSLYQGTQWAVFEPNAEPLWGQVRLSIGTFMQGLFLQGAFAGTTPQQAYFVKCDADNNPDSSIALGIINITVGFAPLYPAEFVVIQIQQMMMSQS
jgi:uncharacterized protein